MNFNTTYGRGFLTIYYAVGWAPKEYNPDDKQSTGGQEQGGGGVAGPMDASAPQSGFVWDEASGYYYDSASGFYYDGNTGLYYDGNNGIWYSYDHQTQQKIVISAPAATITSDEKAASLPDSVQAAANAAIAAEKKEKEKLKEIKLASKSSILANKKKMSNVLTMRKQRSHEGQAPRVAIDDNQLSASVEGRSNSVGPSTKSRYKMESVTLEGTLMGVIRGSGRGVVKSDTSYSGSLAGASFSSPAAAYTAGSSNADVPTTATPFRADASALGSYTPPVAAGSVKRRDRAAERRSLYGSSSSTGDNVSDMDSNQDPAFKRGLVDSMPFPPGVEGGRGSGDATVQSYEVITPDNAIDQSNVGNRMLRNMGWQEGWDSDIAFGVSFFVVSSRTGVQGLGKDGSGMIELVQAQEVEKRAGLGSQQKKKVDPGLEVQAGDSYRTLIQKKAIPSVMGLGSAVSGSAVRKGYSGSAMVVGSAVSVSVVAEEGI
ncbi:suppressor of abi3-5 [Actinidia rufa]|uniref:Suppressor of abi3-5 n=1 Tax=Actinidia rufa TaxID=165716 RepID=A0A7J0GK98_9ERIC|nr:suppressor of abi3-5 [Actinidia rufa]